jgi:hypothetical protein
VRYRIGSDSSEQVALHWNNPLFGDNSFHQNTDPDHFVFRVGGEGNDAVVHFFLRPSELRSTGFLPEFDGFQFANHWPDTPYSLPPLRGSILDLKYGNARSGLCGGMVFAARDYFEDGRSIPATTTPPFGEQDPLFLYLVDRLFDTFSVDTVSLMLKLMNPLYPDTDENVLSSLGLASGRASVMANVEWPLIRADIDAGRPSPMVLITVRSFLPWDLGKCHQVLAYAYEARGDDVELHVYDPNQPRNNDVRLNFNVRTVAERIVVDHNVAVHEDDGQSLRPIICFARMNYEHRTPTVATPPRPKHPAVVVPRQVSLEVVEHVTLSTKVLGRGRKKYEIFDCGEREFDFTLVAQEQRATVAAHAVSYVDPQVEWKLNGVPVPPGAGQTLSPPGSPLGDAFVGPGPDPPVTIRTSVEGLVLRIENNPADGQYGLTAEATVRERNGTEVRRASIGVSFIGRREVVPGLAEAWDQCISDFLDRLRQESPTDAAIAASAYAQANRPPDPIWDPDPLQGTIGWQEELLDPDQALLVDPHQELAPDEVVVVPRGDHQRVVVSPRRFAVVTVPTGVDETVVLNPSDGGVTIVNSTDHDLVVVNPMKHEAVAVIPAKRELALRVVPASG